MKLVITSDHPHAEALLRTALENYALANESIAVKALHRDNQPGETTAERMKWVRVKEERAAATRAMAETIKVGD